MFNIKIRKNTGVRRASEVVTYKKEERKVVKSVPKHDYSTYENSLETKISQNEAINEVIGLIR